jgi:DNA-binding NarL/FixJ family response regulator
VASGQMVTRALEEAIELARAAEDDGAVRTGLTAIALRYSLQQRTENAFHAAEEAVEISRRLGDDLGIARSLMSLAVATAARDGAPAALVIFEEAIVRARASGDLGILNASLNNAADLERSHGLYDAAQAHYEESRSHLFEVGGRTWLVMNSLNLGLLAIARGDPAGSVPFLRDALERGKTAGAPSLTGQTLLALAASAEAHTSARLLGAGHSIMARMDEQVDPNDIPTWEQIEGATREQLSSEEFETAYAAGQALTLEESIGLGFSVANAASPSGASGENAGATVPVTGLDLDLTARELETLRLLASGLSNKEIAAEMVVSVRTVENHVANVYAKIGARGRADATAFALTHGVVEGR